MLRLWQKQPAETPMTLIWPFNVIQGKMLYGKLKGHIWLTIYVSYKRWRYTVPLISYNLFCDLYLTFKGQRSQNKLNDYIWLYTLVKVCIISDILNQIDHKGQNWTFLTLTITFKLILCLSYFRIGLVSTQRIYIIQCIWVTLHYYWIILIITRKWTKPDLSYLENDLGNNLVKSISWQLINMIPIKLHAKKIKCYQSVFEKTR